MSNAAIKATPNNRSSEELAMRDQIEAWGRRRWPTARVVHELVIGQRRIDMAFVTPDHISGVEIKSSRDALDRLDAQVECFQRHLPEVWVALAPKWVKGSDKKALPYSVGRLIVTPSDLAESLPASEDRPYGLWSQGARVDRTVTASMLHMLWHAELTAIAIRKRTFAGKGRLTMVQLIDDLARKLTGDEIVAETCRELRGRNAFWKADDPIRLDAVSAVRPNLFRSPTPSPDSARPEE